MFVLPLPPLVRLTALVWLTVIPHEDDTEPEKLTVPAKLFWEETLSVKLAEPAAVTGAGGANEQYGAVVTLTWPHCVALTCVST
jgi:hypothetical protein